MCMVDWGEGWKVYRSEDRTCAKPFKCCECRRDVERGERYFCATGLGNGETRWETFKMCAHCRTFAASWLLGQCDGYLFHGVYEDLLEHRGEVDGIDLDLGRAIIGMRRKWRRKDGTLMPLAA